MNVEKATLKQLIKTQNEDKDNDVRNLKPDDYKILSKYVGSEKEDEDCKIDGFHLENDELPAYTPRPVRHEVDEYLYYLFYQILNIYQFHNPPKTLKGLNKISEYIQDRILIFNAKIKWFDKKDKIWLRDQMESWLEEIPDSIKVRWANLQRRCSRKEYLIRCKEERHARRLVPDPDNYIDEDYNTKEQFTQFISGFVKPKKQKSKKEARKFNSIAVKRLLTCNILLLT